MLAVAERKRRAGFRARADCALCLAPRERDRLDGRSHQRDLLDMKRMRCREKDGHWLISRRAACATPSHCEGADRGRGWGWFVKVWQLTGRNDLAKLVRSAPLYREAYSLFDLFAKKSFADLKREAEGADNRDGLNPGVGRFEDGAFAVAG